MTIENWCAELAASEVCKDKTGFGLANTAPDSLSLDDDSPDAATELSNPVLGNHQTEAVDSDNAQVAQRVINEAALIKLSDARDVLAMCRGSDGTVIHAGATLTGTSRAVA